MTEAGPGVDGFASGDEVLGWTDDRAAHAELVAVEADKLVPKPAGVSWEAAGSLHVVGATACQKTSGVTPGPITVARYFVPRPDGCEPCG